MIKVVLVGLLAIGLNAVSFPIDASSCSSSARQLKSNADDLESKESEVESAKDDLERAVREVESAKSDFELNCGAMVLLQEMNQCVVLGECTEQTTIVLMMIMKEKKVIMKVL